MELSEQAKKYIRTILEYAEYFDGVQEAIGEAFNTPFPDPIENDEQMAEYDEWYARTIEPVRDEVNRLLYGE
jgi:hypothetical protein